VLAFVHDLGEGLLRLREVADGQVIAGGVEQGRGGSDDDVRGEPLVRGEPFGGLMEQFDESLAMRV
jgi:hypothetical protein